MTTMPPRDPTSLPSIPRHTNPFRPSSVGRLVIPVYFATNTPTNQRHCATRYQNPSQAYWRRPKSDKPKPQLHAVGPTLLNDKNSHAAMLRPKKWHVKKNSFPKAQRTGHECAKCRIPNQATSWPPQKHKLSPASTTSAASVTASRNKWAVVCEGYVTLFLIVYAPNFMIFQQKPDLIKSDHQWCLILWLLQHVWQKYPTSNASQWKTSTTQILDSLTLKKSSISKWIGEPDYPNPY